MKSKNQTARSAAKSKKTAVLLKTMLAILSAWACMTKAQQVIVSQPPAYSTTPPAVREAGTNNEMAVFSTTESGADSLRDEPFQWGLFTFRPHVSYSLIYSDGLELSPSNHQSTAIQQISPGMLVNIGRHWTLDYTPTLKYYSNRRFQDSLDHAVVLAGGTAYGDWTFGVSQGYASTSDSLVETAAQTPTETYNTALNASWKFGDKMSVDFGLQQNFQFVSSPSISGGTNTATTNVFRPNNFTQSAENSRDWSTLEWLNYQFAPRFDVGIGAGVGYVSVDTGPDQTYEQLKGRFNWRATDKISFQVSAGFEERQLQTGNAGDLFNPIFSAAIQYQPFEQTRISLDASRSIAPSYFQGQVQENTSVSADLNQRLLQKFYLDLSVGYNSVRYTGTTGGVGEDRADEYYFLNARLSHPFLKRGNIAIFYQHTANSSSQPGFGYSSNQVGVEVGFSY